MFQCQRTVLEKSEYVMGMPQPQTTNLPITLR